MRPTTTRFLDEKATELANMRFQYEEKLLALKKKYFEKFSKALRPKLAARFFQIENQLLDVVDLQVASTLPVAERNRRNSNEKNAGNYHAFGLAGRCERRYALYQKWRQPGRKVYGRHK